MRVAAMRVTAYLPGVRSLKEKRRAVQSVVDRLRARFNVSVAETDHHDLWQKAEIGIAVVARDGKDLRAVVDAVERHLRGCGDVSVTEVETEYS